MAWGKNRRGSSASASSAPRPSSSGGRRRPPGEPTEQDIARSIQQSAVRVRVTLQLAADSLSLRDVLAAFERDLEARRGPAVSHSLDVRVTLLECGLSSWQQLVELQRVVAALKRPSQPQHQQLAAKTTLRHDAKYDEWRLALGFARESEDALWAFASSLMLRLKSGGVPARVLLPPHRLTLLLASAFVEMGEREVGEYRWEGRQTWRQVVVEGVGEQREEIQRVLLRGNSASVEDPLAGLRYPELVPVVDDMLNGNKDARKPVVVILRGIPGSGKSTLGREIAVICRERGVALTACSADFFFETPRGYVFDVKKLGAAHSNCKGDFTRAVRGDMPRSQGGGKQRRPHQHVVLVDNTSTQRWEYEPYEEIARSSGCRVHIMEMKCPDVLTAYRMGQRNSHGVPPDKVVSMFMRWEDDARAHSFTPQFELARLTANPLSDGEVGGVTYIGLFLDEDAQQKMLAEIPLVHPNKQADHVTLFYRPNKQYTRDAELGTSFTVRGVEVVQDERGQTLRVELDEQLPLQVRNKIPHITMSVKDGVSASYSNELLDSKVVTRTTIDPPIELTARVGAALFVQNQRVITTSSPFAGEENVSSKTSPICSRLFILYVNESDIMDCAAEDTAELLWRAQVHHHLGSQSNGRRMLCVQRTQASASPSLTVLLKRLQDQFLLDPSSHFDDVMEIHHPCSFPEFECAISKYLARCDTINQVKVVTTQEELMQTTEEASETQRPLQNAELGIIRVGLQGNGVQTIALLAPACSTISSVLDLMGVSIDEESRSVNFGGMRALADAWSHIFGADDQQAVRRIDTTLSGLRSSVVELCLTVPSETALIEVAELETKLSSVLEHKQSVQCVVDSCVPGQFYFNLRNSSSYTPVFCVRITSRQKDSDETNTAAQLQLCEHHLRTSREVCDIEAYSVLTALLRAVLLGRCGDLLPSSCRLSSLINLVAEGLVLSYLGSICGADLRPTAEDVTSGRIIFALYGLLIYLSTLCSEGWTAALGDSILALQGNEKAQKTWRNVLANVVQDCKSVLVSNRCAEEGLQEASLLDPHDHLRVLMLLMKPDINEASGVTPVRRSIEVSSRSTWSQLHSLAGCDKLRHVAAMVLPQDDDDDCNGDSTEFFFCAPSLVARRVDVAASSLAVVHRVIEKLHALEDAGSDGALCFGEFVLRSETDVVGDEEGLADLN
ncbi:hypothetical protein PR003_g10037 [Phytophthora rubi]|uniref:tRNA ligase phosphodiesterase domain-containing protein n=1 Tax=Phytophthora rubi TaxID=129364 RepID=A0A6A3N4A2_9STRA|nr:hypothetical protein PR002_g9977 [Phytophthora rubi]KAE9035152.1 hypothetical protein PR001_g9431 [Phytophthora rubi]KAE9341342.1 hypothetical protein PR003_g10037 [Phytophthora rubi]